MPVSSLMVQPCARNSRSPAANAYRRTVALVIPYTFKKLGGREFRKVVNYSPPYYSAFTAVNEHLVLMAHYKKKMLKNIWYFHTNLHSVLFYHKRYINATFFENFTFLLLTFCVIRDRILIVSGYMGLQWFRQGLWSTISVARRIIASKCPNLNNKRQQ